MSASSFNPALWVLICSFAACSTGCQSRDADETTNESVHSESVIFRWDFSDEATEHTFAYHQEVTPPQVFGNSNVELTASLVIRSNGDGTAEVELKDAVVVSDGQQQSAPPSVVHRMKEDGTGPLAEASQDAMLRFLFPLPAIALAPGETSEQEIRFPLGLGRVKGYAPIHTAITLINYEEENDRRIASFNVKFESGDLVTTSGQDFPEGYTMRVSGSGAFRFDPLESLYLGGNLNMRMDSQVSQDDEVVTMTTKIALTPVKKN